MSRRLNGITEVVSCVHSGLALLTLAILAVPTTIAASLNDTGQTMCYQGSTNVKEPCTAAVTGDSGIAPRQDGRYGRDAKAGKGLLTKVGAGAAAFDFTKIANDGSSQPPGATLGANASDWACTKDNVTGLTWEVKTATAGLRNVSNTYTWYSPVTATNGGDPGGVGTTSTCSATLGANTCNTQNYVAAINALNSGSGLCGFADWRLPTPRELVGIIHSGANNPAIDPTYFPNTSVSSAWTGLTMSIFLSTARAVSFFDGDALWLIKTTPTSIRVVRGP